MRLRVSIPRPTAPKRVLFLPARDFFDQWTSKGLIKEGSFSPKTPLPPSRGRSSMARTWILDGRGIARKVKNAQHSSSCLTKDWRSGAVRECPNCKHQIDNSDVAVEWPGLPSGVKFDPSDSELIDHLAGKVGLGDSTPHPLIDEFIPTLEGDDGICYTHPENLPGVKKDGSSVHFFHRTSNAYSTGKRKRRKIDKEQNSPGERVRWHKTGRTRSVIDNGAQKGCKKIMVLYKSAKKSKPDKTNWVMHQYHLGTSEDEKDGELVVSKIFYQQQQSQIEKTGLEFDDDTAGFSARLHSEDPYLPSNGVDPRTPKTNTPDPPKQRAVHLYDEGDDYNLETISLQGDPPQSSFIYPEDKDIRHAWLAGKSQLQEPPEDFDTSLLCNEVLDAFPSEPYSSQKYINPRSENIKDEVSGKDSGIFSGFPDLDNIDIGTPPDFNLADLPFGSQESIMSWLDRL